MSDSFDLLFPNVPLADRARSLEVGQNGQTQKAWLAYAYTTDLAANGEFLETFFSPSELAEASAFRFASRREDFFLGRGAAKLALRAALGESDPASISVSNGMLGQPLVNYGRAHSAEITLTHSTGMAVALAYPQGCPLGIDVEAIAEDRVKTIREELVLSRQEHHWVHSDAMEFGPLHVLLWTVREALAKALCCGLGCPWEILALEDLTQMPGGAWIGRYANFPQFKSVSWIGAMKVFTIALPKLAEPRF